MGGFSYLKTVRLHGQNIMDTIPGISPTHHLISVRFSRMHVPGILPLLVLARSNSAAVFFQFCIMSEAAPFAWGRVRHHRARGRLLLTDW